jgi:glycosyltransferase involved in cell wall biosynthesis
MKLSIITPSFNQYRFIGRTLDSVLLNQDYDYIEHLVIDGCSTDGTLEILQEYKNIYTNKLHYIYEKDSGQSNAINKGFRISTGDIIGWINSDDYYEDNIFRYVVDHFDKNPNVDMIYGGCNIVDVDGKYLYKFEEGYGFKTCKIKDYGKFNYETLLNVYSGLIPQQSVFFRRSIFESIGYLDESFNFTMDYEYWLRIGKICNIARVEKVLANFRTHIDAKTNSKNRLDFIKESMKARKKHGSKIISVINIYELYIGLKYIIKLILIKIHIIQNL